jgi:glycosyltransferase involved in cell wall biosynthesis
MKLLIVTQKVNKDDPILGFFHRWIIEFSKHFDAVTVITLEEGRHDLPVNVKVLSLGKENKSSRVSQLARFYSLIFKERNDYDAVFVHMNPIYLILGGWFWKLSGKTVSLWYTHAGVDTKLRMAERFADVIFTASTESLTLDTSKKRVVGHGIDTEEYASAKRTKVLGVEPISIISVGRVTPIKDLVTLVEAAKILKEKWDKRFTITFIGSPITAKDRKYSDKVKGLIEKYDLGVLVSFAGDVKPADMPARYAAADISVNLTPTGGIDKVVLESMAAGVPVFTSNKAFTSYFEAAGKWSAVLRLADRLIFREGDAKDLAGKVVEFSRNTDGLKIIRIGLQKTAVEMADVTVLMGLISGKLTSWKNK